MTWHELYDSSNGEPVAYFKYLTHLKKFQSKFNLKGIIEKIEKPSNLEFIVEKDNEKYASFEFEPHAIQYNLNFLNGKGEIYPNK
jgi:DNA replicative helicase MCM subunit Mcm2 (Cdc46/Mcm family)